MKKLVSAGLIILALLAGCAVADRARGLKSTFLEGLDVSKQLDNMPFEHSWVWTEVQPDQYRAAIIKPVRLDLLEPDAWEASISAALPSKESFEEKSREVAAWFHDQLVEQIKGTPEARFSITEQPGPGVAVIEIALTELEFSHPLINSGAMIAPLPGASQALAAISNPHAALALRLSDSLTGTLIATVADRKFPPVRMVDLNKATVSSSVREICADWAKEIASALQQGRFGKVERHGVIKLLPW